MVLWLELQKTSGSGQPAQVCAMAETLVDKFSARLYTSKADDQSLDDKSREAAILFSVAEDHLANGQPEEAQRAGVEALGIFRKNKDLKGEVATIRVLVGVLQTRQQYKLAVLMVKDELDFFHLNAKQYGEAVMLLALTEVLGDIGDVKGCTEATSHGLKALEMFRKMDEKELEGLALLALSTVYSKLGKTKDALQAATDAVEVFRSMEQKRFEAKGLHGLSAAHAANRRYDDAIRYGEEALMLFQDLGMRKEEAQEQCNMAQLYLQHSNFEDALVAAEEAQNLYRDLEDKPGEVTCLGMIVHVRCQQGEGEEALQAAKDGLAYFKSVDYVQGQIASMDMISEAHLSSGELADALKASLDALELVQRLGDKEYEATLLHSTSQLYFRLGQIGEALQTVKNSINVFEQLRDERGRAIATVNTLVHVHLALGQNQEALEAVKSAMAIFQKLDDRRSSAVALFVSGTVHNAIEDKETAMSTFTDAKALFKSLNDVALQMAACHALASLYIGSEIPEEAVRLAEEGRRLAEKQNDLAKEVEMLIFASQTQIAVISKLHAESVSRTSTDFTQALDRAQAEASTAKTLATKLDNKQIRGAAAHQLAEVKLVSGHFQEALKEANEAVTLFQEALHPGPGVGEAAALLTRTQILLVMGRDPEANQSAIEGLALAKNCEDKELEQLAEELLARVDQSSGTRMPIMPEVEAAPEDSGPVAAASTAAEEIAKTLDPAEVLDTLHGAIINLIGVEVEADTPFMDAGVDSLLSIEFRQTVAKEFAGLNLGSTLTFDYPNIRALTDHIVERSSA